MNKPETRNQKLETPDRKGFWFLVSGFWFTAAVVAS
jgi:hypothetical protein